MLLYCWQYQGLTAGIDSVGTVPASLITFASIQALQPDILINAGTCGAFKVHFLLSLAKESLPLCVCFVRMPWLSVPLFLCN